MYSAIELMKVLANIAESCQLSASLLSLLYLENKAPGQKAQNRPN